MTGYNYLTGYNYFISYLPIPYRNFSSTKSTNLNSEFHCYKYLFLLLSSRHFLFYKIKYYLGKLSSTVTVLQNHFPPTTEMFKGSHTHSTGKRSSSDRKFKFSDECQIRELAEAYNPRIPPTHNLNPFTFGRRLFPVRCLYAIL